MKFSSYEISFLKENYPIYGSRFCATRLNRSLNSILIKASLLDLKLNSGVRSKIAKEVQFKSDENCKVQSIPFKEPKTPEACYILGLLWADGNVRRGANSISIEVAKDDAKFFIPTFLKTGQWSIRDRLRRKSNRKDITSLYTSNEHFHCFLSQHKYLDKSTSSACSILSIVPNKLKRYWFRGLIDGDGCFYMDKTKRSARFSVSGSFDQDWTYLTDLLSNLDIKFSIGKVTASCGKSSFCRFSGKCQIKKLYEYLYEGDFDNIGLPRKFNYAKSIVLSIKNNSSPIMKKSNLSAHYICK